MIKKLQPSTNKILWACSVVLQDPETNDLFHAMGQMVSPIENLAKQFVIKKAMEKYPGHKLISCRAIEIDAGAIKSLGYVKVRMTPPTQAEINAGSGGRAMEKNLSILEASSFKRDLKGADCNPGDSITARDLFASAALGGCVASPLHSTFEAERIAKWSFMLADVMMEQRNKPPQKPEKGMRGTMAEVMDSK